MGERVRDIDWWYWLAVTTLLVTGLLHWEPALALLHLICAMRTVQLAVAARSLNAFSVQVNIVFLALVVATNLLAPVELFSIALLPAHRREPLSLALLKRTLCAPPRHGSILGATVPRRGVARA